MATDINQRPDPETLLVRIAEDAVRARRGKLKIFFGASAGVGKTYAMLSAAQQQRVQGVDVIIGVVESHGRKETEALLQGLTILPLREVVYRDHLLKEFDLDGALARKPELILMDELAHSNVAGSRHPKRWQDVEELLAAGINVYSTLNVQHLESLNDVVGGITGIRVWETVPDQIFDAADEIVLVDLTPDELLQRLKEGKVYLPHQAERAIQNFFRKGNLIALRELALRRAADSVDSQVLQYRRDQAVSSIWQTRDSLLACIGSGAGADRVLRGAARIATRLDVPWYAVYVETPELQRLPENRRQRILSNLKLAQEMGAESASLSGSDTIESVVRYAREHNLSKIVVGRDRPRAWRPWNQSFAERVGRMAPDLDVIQIAREAGNVSEPPADRDKLESQFKSLQAPWQSYAEAVGICILVVLIAIPLYPVFELSNIAMLFLLAVVLVSVRYGLGPSIMASFLNVITFDFFYVPPRFSFAVSDVQYVMTFAVMLLVGLITAKLTTGLKFQANVASQRERRVRALYEMSRDLSGVLMPEQIVDISERFAQTEFGAKSCIMLADEQDRVGKPLQGVGNAPVVDIAIGQWAFDHGMEAGNGTDTLPASPVMYLPLKAPMRTRGVLALEPSDPERLMAPEQRRLLDTFARLIAISLERIHYVEVAQSTTLQMESERLRNSLLSAISHDLRTPLSVLVGLADSMTMTKPLPNGQQLIIIDAMRDETLRMRSLVNNLLDMARLQSGMVKLNRQWQPVEEVVGSALRAMHTALIGHTVRVNLPADLPLLEFDATLIERVLSNLLENAVKYTPKDSIINIGAASNEPNIDIWVEDNGPGLPPGKEEVIFTKFERGNKESATPGVGLGLAICRAILDAHGGSIHAENRSGGGARFVFSLPQGIPPTIELLEDQVVSQAPKPGT